MNPLPWESLPVRRTVPADWPEGLAEFYALHEGVGLESPPERSVRLCRLHEVQRVTVADIVAFGGDDPAWASFAGFRIGISPYFDQVVYVLPAPVCSRGTIMAFGYDLAGPGGQGVAACEPSLVLAESFAAWLARLEQFAGNEFGFRPGAIEDPAQRAYFRRLNPAIDW